MNPVIATLRALREENARIASSNNDLRSKLAAALKRAEKAEGQIAHYINQNNTLHVKLATIAGVYQRKSNAEQSQEGVDARTTANADERAEEVRTAHEQRSGNRPEG